MKQYDNHQIIQVNGMICTGCERSIENAFKRLPGVGRVRSWFKTGTVEIFSSRTFSEAQLRAVVEEAGYDYVGKGTLPASKKDYGWVAALAIGLILFMLVNRTIGFNRIGDISGSMGYFALFVVGLVTSLHCVAMCGGINLSQCMGAPALSRSKAAAALMPSLLYNSGRVVSYTLIGGIVGGVGSVLSFSGAARGIVAILAGFFMILMGINLLGVFPGISRLIPRLPGVLMSKRRALAKGRTPFLVGLLNGLMPCGPLQAMQLYALGTGSVVQGALSMFFFSLGTVPLMFGLGILSRFMSDRFGRRMVQVGAVLVILLGFMLSVQGLALSGLGVAPLAAATDSASETKGSAASGTKENASAPAPDGEIVDGVQIIQSTLSSRDYPAIIVTAGVPVKWTIYADAANINGCNRTLIIPAYNIQKDLQPGDNVIEFTPKDTGTVLYSCWMGMIRSTITIVDSDSTSSSSDDLDGIGSSDSKDADSILSPLPDGAQNQNNYSDTVLPSAGGCCGQ